MKRSRVIAVCFSVGSILVMSALASWRIQRIYAVKSLPPVAQEPTEPTPRQTYVRLSSFDVQRLLSGNCTTIDTAEQLPDAIKNAFATITRTKPFSLADPGARFNATDVIEDRLPTRRLIISGRCEDRWFIEYEHGGIGKSTALMVLRMTPDQSVALVWGRALKTNADSIEELRAALARSAFWDEPYYW